MIKYFDDKNKNIVNKELFSKIAEEKAKEFGKVYFKKLRNDRNKKIFNSKSQIRKFYDDVLRNKIIIENLAYNNPDEEFRRRLPYIKMLKAKAYYAFEREKITLAFKEFIEENVDIVEDMKDFEVFCNFFEAIVAFSAMYVQRD